MTAHISFPTFTPGFSTVSIVMMETIIFPFAEVNIAFEFKVPVIISLISHLFKIFLAQIFLDRRAANNQPIL